MGSNITFSSIEFQKNKCVTSCACACMHACMSVLYLDMCICVYVSHPFIPFHFFSPTGPQVQEHGRGVRRLPLQHHHRRVSHPGSKCGCIHDDKGNTPTLTSHLLPVIPPRHSHPHLSIPNTAASSAATTPLTWGAASRATRRSTTPTTTSSSSTRPSRRCGSPSVYKCIKKERVCVHVCRCVGVCVDQMQ